MTKHIRDTQGNPHKKAQTQVRKPGVQRHAVANTQGKPKTNTGQATIALQRFATNPHQTTPAQIIALQQTAGNQAVTSLIQQMRSRNPDKIQRYLPDNLPDNLANNLPDNLPAENDTKPNKSPITHSKAHSGVIQRWPFSKNKNKKETEEPVGTISNNPLSGQSQITTLHEDMNEDGELFDNVVMNDVDSDGKNIEEVNRSQKREKLGLAGYYGTSGVSSGGSYAATQTLPGVFKVGSAAMSGLSALTGVVSSVLGGLWVRAVTKRANRAKERRNLSYEYHKAVKSGENPSRFRTKRQELDKEDSEKLTQTSSEAQQFAQEHAEDSHQLQIGNAGLNGTPDEQFMHVMEYFASKNDKKRWRARMEGTAYAVGVAGGLATTAGMIALGVGLTALLASNPIGWGIAIGLSFAGVAYTLGQYLHKAYRRSKRWQQGHGGERAQAATTLYDLAKSGHPYSLMFLEELGVLKPDTHGDNIGRTGKSKWYNPFSWGKGKQRKGFFHYKEFESNTAENYYGQGKDETDVKSKVIEYLMSKTRSY